MSTLAATATKMNTFTKFLIATGLLVPMTSANAQPQEKQDEMARFVSKVLGSTELQWRQIFAKDGKTYRAPMLVLYHGATHSPCGGVAESAMGPFLPGRPEDLPRHLVPRPDCDPFSPLRRW